MYPVVKPGDRIRYEDYSGNYLYGVVVSFVNDENEVLQREKNDPHYVTGEGPEYHYLGIAFDDASFRVLDYTWCEVLCSLYKVWIERRG